MKKIGIILLIGAVGYYFYRKVGASKNIKAILRGVKFGGNFLSPKIYVQLGIQNPTSVTVKINSFVGKLTSNNKTIADISSFQKLDIPGNSESLLNIQLEPFAIGIFSEIKRLIKTGVTLPKFTLEGSLNVDNTTYPVFSSLN